MDQEYEEMLYDNQLAISGNFQMLHDSFKTQ